MLGAENDHAVRDLRREKNGGREGKERETRMTGGQTERTGERNAKKQTDSRGGKRKGENGVNRKRRRAEENAPKVRKQRQCIDGINNQAHGRTAPTSKQDN